jgi:hypothetical protein
MTPLSGLSTSPPFWYDHSRCDEIEKKEMEINGNQEKVFTDCAQLFQGLSGIRRQWKNPSHETCLSIARGGGRSVWVSLGQICLQSQGGVKGAGKDWKILDTGNKSL